MAQDDTTESPDPRPQNVAETMRDVMAAWGDTEALEGLPADPTEPALFSLPEGRSVTDFTSARNAALEFFKPLRRRGKDDMQDLDSLILWANRFKGDESVIFAYESAAAPSLTCVADYHAEGPALAFGREPTARHCAHQARYQFPLSDEWRFWNKVSGQWLSKDEMGELIETRALDVFEPTPALLGHATDDAPAPWEAKLVRIATALNGRFGRFAEFLELSRRFEVHEKSNLKITRDRNTGVKNIEFTNEHNAPDGTPLQLPNLLVLAIPVVVNGPKYRMALLFRYEKRGQDVKFQFTLYEPHLTLKAVFDEAVARVADETGMPAMRGQMGSPAQ